MSNKSLKAWPNKDDSLQFPQGQRPSRTGEQVWTSEIAPTLCFPDTEKSCFACCPPIRPAGYEHIQHKSIVKRILRENTLLFADKKEWISPITGFSCWALGYLDKRYRLVGCLLHPAQNGGADLRYRVDYGDKCRRETCPESNIFLDLGINERRFWIRLVDGLDSFAYSSNKNNPLFKMMGWGPEILRLVASHEDRNTFSKESFFRAYPFFSTKLHPRANAYLLNKLVRMENIALLKAESFRGRFKTFSAEISGRLRQTARQMPNATHTHLLTLDPYFLDFLRLSVGLTKIHLEEAVRLKKIVHKAIRTFQDEEGFS